MWSQLFLFALVGFVAASDYGWKSNTEYMYKVHGRTLTGLHEVANQYSGMMMKANLIVRPKSDGILMAKIVDAKYAQVHTQLPQGWRSEIPESKLNYQQLEISEKPFQIVLKNGVVQDVIVSKEVQNWEANILRSIVSQIQLDTQAENVIKSNINQLPEEESNNAVFKTMEDTITGKYETLYDITELPEYVLQSQPWLVPMPQLKGDGEFIEIVKSKNFSRGEERLGYHYGMGNMGHWEPSTNQMGEFFIRSSLSRAVISGNLKRYTIQSSATTNKIILSPTLNSEQKGMVVSHLNLTLSHVKQSTDAFEAPQQRQNLGSLVYSFNTPFSENQQAKQGQRHREEQNQYSSEEQDQYQERHHYRQRRSYKPTEYSSVENSEEWQQEEAKLDQPPHSPLLPLYIGNKGESIKSSERVNIVHAVQKIAQQIGQEIQRPEHMPKEQTLAKYTILSSLLRIMSEKEMQQVARELYTKDIQGVKTESWKAFRDAVAECGTGPALLIIQDWIKTNKLSHEEAAEVIASMAESVRQPTEEYMRTFYKLATQEQVKQQYLLNDTAILSYSKLARQVYVDKHASHNQFPVHSFGTFRTEEGKKFVTEQLIPYLKQELKRAVEEADSHKVIIYIRALGNVAHKQILAVFQPYLEGDKQVSQFQRLQIVLAFDKLVKTHPKTARSVLYKIYQNAGDMQEVRAAAVYQLMRTCPPASMLQRMAQYTNIDTDEQVNSAVKSAIESAAQLEGAEFSELAENARSAVPLLTKQTYGVQYSRDQLSSFVVDHMNLFYKQTLQTYGSQDSILPKGIKYALRAGLGGARRQLFNVQAIVSSIDELTNVFEQQTESYHHNQQQQKQNYQQAQQNQWSSESIARMLNIETEEREQLEGSLLFQIGGGASRFFNFNNRTIEQLPRVVREIEDLLREGKNIHYTKYLNRYEVAISFPTETAFPFIYTLDAPTVLHLQGQIRATAEPKISADDRIRSPKTVTVHTELRAIVATKIQAKLGFVTPFDHQQYVSGFDKNVQVYLPLKSQMEIDIKNMQMHSQMQFIEPAKNAQVFHYSTYPYTAKHDILSLEPLANKPNTHVIESKTEGTSFSKVLGRETGVAFRVEIDFEQNMMDARWFNEQSRLHDGVSALLAPFYTENIQRSKVNIEYVAQESTARKVQFRMGYEKKYENEQGHKVAADIKQFAQLPREQKARQQQFAKMAASGIHSADVHVYDVAIEFDGQNKVEYTATAAIAQGPADDNSRALFYMKKYSANQHESKPYQLAMSAKAKVPNTNGLDFVYALKFDPTTTAQVELAFGENLEQATKLNIHAKLEKSESRRQYLQRHPRAHECRREMEEGNQQLPACANMTQEANLLDRVQVQVQFQHVTPEVRNMTQKVYNGLRYLTYFNFEENTVNAHGYNKESQIDMEAHFYPDFEAVNVTLRAKNYESHITNLPVNYWAKQVVVVHPVYNVVDRVMSEVLDYDTYKPICVVDKIAANTFDNKTYPIDLGHAWHLMLQYVPTYARQQHHEQNYQQQQKEQQQEQFAVLVRDAKSGNSEKEVMITIRTPETDGKLYEIELKPVEQQRHSAGSEVSAKVYVNQKEQQCNDQQVINIEGGFIRIYALPNGEIKIEVRDNFFVIYDGERIKLAAEHDKFRGAVRGLCGTFTGEESDDFLTPKNCILRNPLEFASTYAVEQQGRVQEYQSRAQKAACYFKDIVYANVISENDVKGIDQQNQHQERNQYHNAQKSDSCTKHQTRYIVDEDEDSICFTIRPVPVCKSSCTGKYMKKSVPVHCTQKTSVTALWKQQIEQGASPDFSHKSATKSVQIDVPEYCRN